MFQERNVCLKISLSSHFGEKKLARQKIRQNFEEKKLPLKNLMFFLLLLVFFMVLYFYDLV